jgi:prepilin-type processing-associated H-X9-DG protein
VKVTRNDVIVGGVLCSLLFAGLLSANQNADEQNRRVKCASNLKQLGMAIMLYANENKGAFPRTRYDSANEESVAAFTGVDASHPFAKGGPEANDVTASIFLILRTEDLGNEVFVCPSGKAKPLKFPAGKDFSNFSNFTSLKNLGYSYINAYPSKAAVAKGFKLNFTLPADFAIMADLNPGGDALAKLDAHAGGDEMKKGNSPNHEQLGQNVLFADGHVEWAETPFCGQKRSDGLPDNIYTRFLPEDAPKDADPIMGPAMDQSDSVLLPSADAKERVARLARSRPAKNPPSKNSLPVEPNGGKPGEPTGL